MFNYHDIEEMISKGTTAAKLEHYIKTHNITKKDAKLIDFKEDLTNKLLCYVLKNMLRDMNGCVLPYSVGLYVYVDRYEFMWTKLCKMYSIYYNRGLEILYQVYNILYS